MSEKDVVIHVHVHQAVRFGGSLATYFTAKPAPGKVRANFKMRTDIGCIEIFNSSDRVLIPLVNISAIHLDCEREQQKDEKKRAEKSKPTNTLKSTELKRPVKIGKD